MSNEAMVEYIKSKQCEKCSDIGLCGGCAVLIALNLIKGAPADLQEMSTVEESRLRVPWRWLEDFACEYRSEQYDEFVLAAKRSYVASVEKLYATVCADGI